MNIHADKKEENKSQTTANTISKKKNDTESVSQLVDNRAEAVAQRKLQETANNSSDVKQLMSYQERADNFTSQITQRKENTEEEILQGKFESIQKKENNTGLPDNLKTGIENLSGYSMNDVKVHYNSDKPAQLQAHAYAQGTDIHLGSGQEKHLPHEAWHVVQQKQGRVKPTIMMKGIVGINDDTGLEQEADVMGDKAIQKKDEINQTLIKESKLGDVTQLSKGESALKYGLMGATTGMAFGAWVGSYIPSKIGNVVGGGIGGFLGGIGGAIYGAQGHWDTIISVSSLSSELQLGLAGAKASPSTRPSPLPAWVKDTVEIGLDYEGQIVAKKKEHDTANGSKWENTPNIKNNNTDKNVWVAAQSAKTVNAFKLGLDKKVKEKADSEFKWNEDFNNNDGKLPGLKGAGGYKEYYAPPTPGTTGAGLGTWGKNRILQKKSTVGGYENSWWATKDHYTYFYKVG